MSYGCERLGFLCYDIAFWFTMEWFEIMIYDVVMTFLELLSQLKKKGVTRILPAGTVTWSARWRQWTEWRLARSPCCRPPGGRTCQRTCARSAASPSRWEPGSPGWSWSRYSTVQYSIVQYSTAQYSSVLSLFRCGIISSTDSLSLLIVFCNNFILHLMNFLWCKRFIGVNRVSLSITSIDLYLNL